MARIARRSLRLQNLPLFSLREPWVHASDTEGKVRLQLFEPRHLELARRIELPGGTGQLGYTDVLERRKGGSGVLVKTDELQWAGSRSDGPVSLHGTGTQRFRVLALNCKKVEQGTPLHLAHVQLLADQDVARFPAGDIAGGSGASTGLPRSIYGEIYTQERGWGFSSYHFEEDGGAYISYESGFAEGFPTLDDGSRPPERKRFEDASYDPTTRVFRGTVNWFPTAWQGVHRWQYEMVFSLDLGAIVGGGIRSHKSTGDEDDKQVFDRYGVQLYYKRTQMGIDGSEKAVKEVLLQSGVAPSAVEASLNSANNCVTPVGRSSRGAGKVAQPVMQQRRQLRYALKAAITEARSENARLRAVEELACMACPPAPVMAAEDALHEVLLKASGDTNAPVQTAASEGLSRCWATSGDADVDAALRQGLAFMEQKRMQDAIDTFTRVVDMAPRFAEGWNVRAVALCSLGEYDRAVADCKRALALKPRHFGCLTGLGMCKLAQGDKISAFQWFRVALEVYPGMPGVTVQMEQAEFDDIMETHVNPRMKSIVAGFKQTGQVSTDFDGACSWDVHRIRLEEEEIRQGTIAYFFRVRVRNPVCSQRAVQNRARFYVLQQADGSVIPFARPTRSEDRFRLEPGAEHCFAWVLLLGQELRGASAGTLLERLEEVESLRFVVEEMPPLLPMDAPEVDKSDLPRLGKGHSFMGQLDLRKADHLKV